MFIQFAYVVQLRRLYVFIFKRMRNCYYENFRKRIVAFSGIFPNNFVIKYRLFPSIFSYRM